MSKKPRICFLAYRQIREKALPILAEYANRADIEVVQACFEQALALAQERVSQSQVDVFVSAGSNASMLRRSVAVPVATIVLGGLDILQAVMQVRPAQQIGVITYGHVLPELDAVQQLLKVKLLQYAYQSPAEVTDCVQRLRALGVGAVVGSSLVVDSAEQAGLRGLLAYSSASIRKGFDDALELARVARLEAGRYEQLDSVLRHLQEPVLAVDLKETVIAINPAMRTLLGVAARQPVLGQPLTALTAEVSMRPVLTSGQPDLAAVLRVHGRDCVVNRTPILEQAQVSGAAMTLHDAAKIHEADNNLRIQRRSRDPQARYRFEDLCGASAAYTEALELARLYARTDFNVLLQGESGSGKELFAQAIHNASSRAHKPFVVLNCAAVPESLLESELFGHEEGAFTGARRGGRRGLFEAAHTGTLVLDEIGDMPLGLQTRLLRVLQERQITRLGASTAIPVDVRVIAATHRPLAAMLKAEQFRPDLYYRISTLPLHLPALRERGADVLLLARRMLRQASLDLGLDSARIEPLLAALAPRWLDYPWPGNVRELENLCRRLAVALLSQPAADLQEVGSLRRLCPELFQAEAADRAGPTPAPHSPSAPTASSQHAKPKRARKPMTGPEQLGSQRRAAALQALAQHHGKVGPAASALGVSRVTLWRWSKGTSA